MLYNAFLQQPSQIMQLIGKTIQSILKQHNKMHRVQMTTKSQFYFFIQLSNSNLYLKMQEYYITILKTETF